MQRTANGVAAVGIAAVLALTACGSQEEPADEPSTEAASESATPEETATQSAEADTPVPELLDFTAATLDGGQFEGASTLGDPTVLWFWEHDCPICQSQGPAVAGLFDEHGDQIDVVGVSGAGLYAPSSADDRAGFVEQTGTDGIVHIEDEDYGIRGAFGVVSQSTFVVIDAEGEVVESGSLSEEDLNEAVDALL
ncbi:TlpA family protein disulfide reductase [Glycomyces tarimensis]